MTIPLFKSHYSLGKSILTLEKEDLGENYPTSVFSLANQGNLEEVPLVEDNMSGFLQAYTNAKDLKVKLIFGLRVTICQDMTEKSEESLKKSSKIILFTKNAKGYKKLIKIYSDAARIGFYYVPRIDYKYLSENWDENNLKLCIPFYDSFIEKNMLWGSSCVPDFSFTSPTFFVENNDLPFDHLIEEGIVSFVQKKYQQEKTKSIYYENKNDFKAYLTFRCINNRSTLDKPNLDHMSSDEFSFESWKEQNG